MNFTFALFAVAIVSSALSPVTLARADECKDVLDAKNVFHESAKALIDKAVEKRKQIKGFGSDYWGADCEAQKLELEGDRRSFEFMKDAFKVCRTPADHVRKVTGDYEGWIKSGEKRVAMACGNMEEARHKEEAEKAKK